MFWTVISQWQFFLYEQNVGKKVYASLINEMDKFFPHFSYYYNNSVVKLCQSQLIQEYSMKWKQNETKNRQHEIIQLIEGISIPFHIHVWQTKSSHFNILGFTETVRLLCSIVKIVWVSSTVKQTLGQQDLNCYSTVTHVGSFLFRNKCFHQQ